ncbi:MAG: peptidylprolyl isomerase [Nanoarchaeota archaeon]|nr:peptidylprolyl isomerase [Nanoarchaeota archaeon]
MALKKNQFIEIDFTGRVKDTNEIFDTTNQKDAKSMGADKVKPLILCIGEGMLPEKFDAALEGKEIGKEYSLDLNPKEAFGERKKDLVKMLPLKIFTDKGIMPYRGLMLNLDDMIVRIGAVSGGRVIADFNNPLAGKSIIYTFKINKIVEDKKIQIEALLENMLKIDASKVKIGLEGKKATIEFDLKENEFKILNAIVKPFSEKVKSLVDVELEIKNKESKK